MAIKKGDRKARYLREDLDELQKSASGFDTVVAALELRFDKVAKSTETIKDRFEDHLNIGKKILANRENILKVDIQGEDLSGKISAAKKRGNKDELDLLRTLNSQLKVQQGQQKVAQKKVGSFNKTLDTVVDLVGKIPIIGDAFATAISPVAGFIRDAFAEGVGHAINSPKGIKGMGEGLKAMFAGVGIKVAAGLLGIMTLLVARANNLGTVFKDTIQPSMLLFGGTVAEAAEEFGHIDTLSFSTLASLKWHEKLTGLTAANQIKIMGAMAATSDYSEEVLRSMMMAYKGAGVPFKLIMDDVARNMKLMAEFGKDGGTNIMDAAKHARQLGINLDDVASISDSLLDFESSINAEMEASVIFGRSINLDRARQLNFAGEHSKMLDEIVRQVGSEAEFNRMNVIQRKKVAAAVGLTVSGLSKLVREEKAAEKSMAKTYLWTIAIATGIGGILGMIAGATRNTVLSMKGIGVGGAAGAGIGLGIGLIASAGIAASRETPEFASLPSGRAASLQSGAGIFHGGETVVNTTDLENMGSRQIVLLEGIRSEIRNLAIA